MTPQEGAKCGDGKFRDRDWWESYYSDQFKSLEDRYNPDGFMLLENQLMDSSKLGYRYVLPFGGSASYPEVPEHPFSVDATASGTVCVMGVYRIKKS
jgi:hypothetical protein